MGIRDNESNQNQPEQPKAQPQPTGRGPTGYGGNVGAAAPKPAARGLNDPRDINTVFRRSGQMDGGEERTSQAFTAIRDAYKTEVEMQRMPDDFHLIRFDSETHRVGRSSILVVKVAQVAQKTAVAIRVVMLDSDRPLRKRKEWVGQTQIEVTTFSQDVYTEKYWAKVVNTVFNQLGIQPEGRDVTAIDAGPILVPRHFDFKLESVEVKRLLIDSVNRVDDGIQIFAGEVPFRIEDLKPINENGQAASNTRFVASFDFTAEPKFDIVGNPIRSDVIVRMGAQVEGDTKDEDEFYEENTALNELSCFVGVEFTGGRVIGGQPQGGWGSPNQQQVTQPFMPTVVITNNCPAPHIQSQTGEFYMLGLSNAFRLTYNYAWLEALKPRLGVKGVDWKDIGALGYKMPFSEFQYVDLKAKNYSDQNFLEFVRHAMEAMPAFLIDVQPMSENSAFETFLLDAATPGKYQNQARKRLIAAADNLTSGRFSQAIAEGDPLVRHTNQEILLGRWVDDQGQIRDLRELDVLAMLNITKGDQVAFDEWYAIFCGNNPGGFGTMPAAMRLDRLEKLTRQYAGSRVEVTGRAARLALTPGFIKALDDATAGAGLQVELENISQVLGGNQRFAGNQFMSQFAVDGQAHIHQGGSTVNQNRGHVYQGNVAGSGRYY
jgi:hypothetical protein